MSPFFQDAVFIMAATESSPLSSLLGLIVLCAIVVMAAKSFLPELKGWFGEFAINGFLRQGLNPLAYRLIPSITLPTPDGTTQIDHVVVSRYGIFVVETKFYKGWIFGGERDAQWKQVLYRKKYRFQNPLRQNFKHTKTLSELTSIPEEYFKSVVVFAGHNTLKPPKPPNVVRPPDLVPYIRSHRTVLIKDAQVPEIVQVIGEWATTVTRRQKHDHVRNLKGRHAPVAATVATDAAFDASVPSCPRCGTAMVLRTKRRDGANFWGCSTYPQCRGTRQVG